MKLLEETALRDVIKPSGIHITLMKVFYRDRNSSPDFFLKSSYHAKKALINGDSSGMAAYHLFKELNKEKKIQEAIRIRRH